MEDLPENNETHEAGVSEAAEDQPGNNATHEPGESEAVEDEPKCAETCQGQPESTAKHLSEVIESQFESADIHEAEKSEAMEDQSKNSESQQSEIIEGMCDNNKASGGTEDDKLKCAAVEIKQTTELESKESEKEKSSVKSKKHLKLPDFKRFAEPGQYPHSKKPKVSDREVPFPPGTSHLPNYGPSGSSSSGQMWPQSTPEMQHGPGIGPYGPSINQYGPGEGPPGPSRGPPMPGFGPPGPGMGPSLPGMGPSMPGMGPSMPGMGLSMPGMGPSMPGMGPSMPGMGPSMPGMGHLMPGMRPPGPAPVYYYHSETRISSWIKPQNACIIKQAVWEKAHQNISET
ncbi:unnamed protein product, partial [Candidula unifasciata]